MSAVPMQVTLLDSMGTDLTIVNAARVSFNKESEFVSRWNDDGEEVHDLSAKDERLVNYLAKHNHWTTFGHCVAQFRVKAPIFVARQLVKHQVGLVWNEVSRRYVDGTPEYWLPTTLKSRPEGSIKQGAGLVHPNSSFWIEQIEEQVIDGIALYDAMIADDIAPEQARMVLSLNTMTEWWWTGSLAAWARVCNLRLDPHAQEETREVAEAFSIEMSKRFPIAWEALTSKTQYSAPEKATISV